MELVMGVKTSIENGRIALTMTPKGIETISFLSADKDEALSFYLLIRDSIDDFEKRIKQISNTKEVETDG